MNDLQSNGDQKPKSLFRVIFITGFIAGILDATAASLNFWIRTGKSPLRVFQFIASGVFGKDPEPSGNAKAAWGLLFHFCIAYLFTLIFFLIYTRIKIASKNAFITGIIYGCFVWLVMNLVVVPLSNTPKLPFNLAQTILGVIFLIVCIGLPNSLIAKKFYSK